MEKQILFPSSWTHERLLSVIKNYRKHQRVFHNTHSQIALNKAKAYERLMDDFVRETEWLNSPDRGIIERI